MIEKIVEAQMDKKKSTRLGAGAFPQVDRSVVTVAEGFGESDEKAYWLTRTPLQRLDAVELLREIAFSYDPTTTGLQRVLETAQFPPH